MTVQLESIVLSASTEPVSAADPTATGSNDLLRNLLTAGIGVVAAPLWYLGFPLTFPLAVGVGVYGFYAISKIFLPFQTELMHVLNGIAVGSFGWVAGPLIVGSLVAGLFIPHAGDPVAVPYSTAAVPAPAPEPAPVRFTGTASNTAPSALPQRANRGGATSATAAVARRAAAAAHVAPASTESAPFQAGALDASTRSEDPPPGTHPEPAARKGSATSRDSGRAEARDAGRRYGPAGRWAG